jgi:hypothetical protein
VHLLSFKLNNVFQVVSIHGKLVELFDHEVLI